MVERAEIIVKGIVQGVGFRPFVYALAEALELKGYVTNTSEGVFIDVEGARIPEFIQRLQHEAPPLSRITEVCVNPLPFLGYSDFTIHQSADQSRGRPFTLISPDVSICDDCLRELLDPADRRYLYPFINCTNCGPRYSITKSVPYDRPNTTMAAFPLCPDCRREYHDPRDRRFHAQPNACVACGPHVEFRVPNSEFGVQGADAIRETIKLLQKGGIIAVKGLGGFHIACDASNDTAVKRLRKKKRKSNKPFAVMAPDIKSIEQFCDVPEEARMLLQSNRRPIMLLCKRSDHALSDAVSPNNNYIGCMLPYTPLHYLLFYYRAYENPPLSPFFKGGGENGPPLAKGGKGGFDGVDGLQLTQNFLALVMTSGNLSEEPIVHDNNEAVKKLSHIVDGFLLHNRDIFMRVDDSVARLSSIISHPSSISFLRRSRGYAPDPIALHDDGPEVLGCGADLKNTFTLTKGEFAILSQHIGDMENYETVKFFEECLENLKQVYRVNPIAIVHDLHPGYVSTQWAMKQRSGGMRQGVREREENINSAFRIPHSALSLYGIQHHYAHIGSVMAEHGLKSKVIGVAFDGTGYGTDGNLWGGEFLIADIDGFERTGQFKYIPLPGGESAIREPWKTAVSFLLNAEKDKAWDYLEQIGFIEKYKRENIQNLALVARSRELSPLSSGAGRLFDAVSALLGICDLNTFEGEAAMALESFTRDGIEEEYHVEFVHENGYTVLDYSPTIIGIVTDMVQHIDKKTIATKFHNTVASVVRTMARVLSKRHGIYDVALSGGTFQNLYLLNRTTTLLASDGLNVYTNQKSPCNDACISLGQAYLVRERLKKCEI